MAGIPIGQLLVQQGVLTHKQVQHILEVQRLSHRPFGDLAERLYGVSPEAVEDTSLAAPAPASPSPSTTSSPPTSGH